MTQPETSYAFWGIGTLVPIEVNDSVLDNAHRGKGAAVEAAADRRPLIIDGATPLAQVHAGPIGAPPEHQLASDVPLGH
jgi:hypothetical protein